MTRETLKLLVISPTPSHPQNAGSRARVYNLLWGIRQMGHNLHFLHIGAEAGGDVEAMRESWGNQFYYIPYSSPVVKSGFAKMLRKFVKSSAPAIDAWYDPALNKTLNRLHRANHFDVVLVEYVFFSRAFECFGQDVLKIVDTIDVFSNRHERMRQHGLQPNWYSATSNEEARGLSRADVVIAISEEDRQTLANLVSTKIITIGHLVQLREPIEAPLQSGKLLFVGSANPMNVQAIQFFVREILPDVRRQHPVTQLLIAGSVCEVLEDCDAYIKLGQVPDLHSVYASVDVVLNPMLFGTGLSIKGLEALGHARPLVTTSIGARGLWEGAGEAFLVADTPEAFSSAVVNILSDVELALKLSRNGYELAAKWNQQNMKALRELFDV